MDIKLNWYGDYGIEVVRSGRQYEEYVLPNDEKIQLFAETYRFIFDFLEYRKANGPDEFENLKEVLKQIEKLVLIKAIKGIKIPYSVQLASLAYIGVRPVTEGAKTPEIRWEHLTGALSDVKANELEETNFLNVINIEKDKKIIFQSRKPWRIELYETDGICEKCGQKGEPEEKAMLRSRFAFGIIPKEAKKVKDV